MHRTSASGTTSGRTSTSSSPATITQCCPRPEELEEITAYIHSLPVMRNVLGVHTDSLQKIVSNPHQNVANITVYSHQNQIYDFIECFCNYANNDYAKFVERNGNILAALNFTALKGEVIIVEKQYDSISLNLKYILGDCDKLIVSYTTMTKSIRVRRIELDNLDEDMLKKYNQVQT